MPVVRMRNLGKGEPSTGGVIKPAGGLKPPYMVGQGTTDYACPACGVILLHNLEDGQIRDVAVFHDECGTYSAP
jgi:hypothetical protein